MQKLLVLFLIVLPNLSLAAEPAEYFGFAQGKNLYFVLSETFDGAAEKHGAPSIQKLLLHFEIQDGDRRYSPYNHSQPSNCVAHTNAKGEWLRVVCATDSSSPLNGVTYQRKMPQRSTSTSGFLVCASKCGAKVPRHLELAIVEDEDGVEPGE